MLLRRSDVALVSYSICDKTDVDLRKGLEGGTVRVLPEELNCLWGQEKSHKPGSGGFSALTRIYAGESGHPTALVSTADPARIAL
jgi:hypothetical protein